MAGGREGCDDRRGEEAAQFEWCRVAAELGRESVDGVELAGGDRRDQERRELVERARPGWCGCRRSCYRLACGFVRRGQPRDALTSLLPRRRSHHRQKAGPGEQLERGVEHEGIRRLPLRGRDDRAGRGDEHMVGPGPASPTPVFVANIVRGDAGEVGRCGDCPSHARDRKCSTSLQVKHCLDTLTWCSRTSCRSVRLRNARA